MSTNQRYIALLTGLDPEGTLAELKLFVPHANVVDRKAERLLIDCPIWCEGLLVSYFQDDEHIIQKVRTYRLQAV